MRTFAVPEDLLYKLIPIEMYVERSHESPYCYQLNAGRRTLSVFGSAHSNIPDEQQFALLEQTYRRIDPEVVFVEGFDAHASTAHVSMLLGQMNREEAILRGGESTFTLWLAHKGGAEQRTIEPGDDELYTYLLTLGFSREDIFAWAVLRLLPQYIRRRESMSFTAYATPFVRSFSLATKWERFTYSTESACRYGSTILRSELSDTNFDLALHYTDPRAVAFHDNDYTVLNTMSAVADELRDRTAITKVLRALGSAERVLMVVGAGHAVMQEPVYRTFFTKLRS